MLHRYIVICYIAASVNNHGRIQPVEQNFSSLTPLWSYYSDNNKGICLKFDVLADP